MRWLLLLFCASVVQAAPWQVMVNVDLSTGAKQGGEAIVAGATLAVEEINAAGGVLGQPIELVIRDHRANPARGIHHVEQAANIANLLAILGGVHTPVVLAELDAIHRQDLIYLVPWAAGTGIIDNGYTPSNVFRLSLRDEWVGAFFIEQLQALECEHSHALLERTGWGRSNAQALADAANLYQYHVHPPAWFNWQTKLFPQLVDEIYQHGDTDCLVFVGNTPDAVNFINAVIDSSNQPSIISHWGITADDFVSPLTLERLQGFPLYWVNTHAAGIAKTAVGAQLLARYQTRYGPANNSYNGVVHAYDLMHLLALAVTHAGEGNAAAIRQGFYAISEYQGAIKQFQQPFNPNNHEALAPSDLLLLQLNDQGLGVPR